MSPILSKASIACGILLACATAAHSQSLAFNILGGYAGRASADGAGSLSRFNNPGGTALDAAGNLYVADTDSHTIRQVTPAGVASTLAGLPNTALAVSFVVGFVVHRPLYVVCFNAPDHSHRATRGCSARSAKLQAPSPL